MTNPHAEYTARRLATQLNLRRYFNACVPIMAQEEAGEITMEDALNRFNEIDVEHAKLIVDDIAPEKRIIEL